MLVYLLARPDNWRVLVGDLRRRGDLGRDGVYKVLRELRDAGYVLYQRKRDSDGRLRGGDYYVSELPRSPHPALPDTAEPDPAPPDPVKPEALPNTESKEIRTTTTKQTTNKDHKNQRRPSVEFASWVPENLKAQAESVVSDQPPDLAQLIIDEWAGNLATGAIERSPLGYLRALVLRLNLGEFIPRYANGVARSRAGQIVTH